MRTYREAKTMAATLRQALKARSLTLSHSECLEIVAQQFGVKDWNVLAARLGDGQPGRPADLALPLGWGKAGRHADFYAAGVDPDVRHGALRAAVIRSNFPPGAQEPPAGAFATLMQTVSARPWHGSRIALEAQLRSLDVQGAGAIWLRVDDASGRMLAFDNMEGRAAGRVLAGTENWTRRRIVLDVATQAATVHYGFMLRGTGSLWVAAMTLQEVGRDSPTTEHRRWHHEAPANLDFDLIER